MSVQTRSETKCAYPWSPEILPFPLSTPAICVLFFGKSASAVPVSKYLHITSPLANDRKLHSFFNARSLKTISVLFMNLFMDLNISIKCMKLLCTERKTLSSFHVFISDNLSKIITLFRVCLELNMILQCSEMDNKLLQRRTGILYKLG